MAKETVSTEGYKPKQSTRGYQPSKNNNVQNGYQPEKGKGTNNPGNKPTPPPKSE